MYDKRNTTPLSTASDIHQRRLAGFTWEDIREEFGMSMNTAKAILERHGFDHSPLGPARKRTDKWNRPCIKCGKKETRSVGLFLCKSCRKNNRESYDGPEDFYGKGA